MGLLMRLWIAPRVAVRSIARWSAIPDGWPEARLRSFAAVFAVGLDAGVFQRPPGREPDPRAQDRRAIVQGADRPPAMASSESPQVVAP